MALATFNGLAAASTATVNGLAVASISDVNGLAWPSAAVFHTKSVDLDGSTEYMKDATETTLGIVNDFTVEAWFKPGDVTSNQEIVRIAAASSNDSQLLIRLNSSSKIQVLLYNTSAAAFKNFSSSASIVINTIYSVAITFNGTTGDVMSLYIDGVDVTGSATKTTDNSGTMQDANRAIGIGVNPKANDLRFDGLISKVSIWSSVLDSANLAVTGGSNGFQLDLRNASGDYDQQANLVHQWALGKSDTDAAAIGTDYVSSGGRNVGDDAANITSADVVDFT